MVKKKSPEAPELPLFDLPLHASDPGRKSSKGASWFDDDKVDPPLAGGEESSVPDPETDVEPEEETGAIEEEESGAVYEELPAPFRDRLLAGLLDLGIQLLVLGGAVAAVHAMDIEVTLADTAPFALLGLIFSFLYWFVPLAFWGQTPGMAWVGNSAVSLNDEPLTFGQSVLRWFGALLTLALAGLPLALALGGRSLTDRLSDSKTVLL